MQVDSHIALTRLKAFGKAMVPYTPALLYVGIGVAGHAQSFDIDQVTTLLKTIKNGLLAIGAVLILISLVFSVFSFIGGNIMRGITGVAGVLLGAAIIGWGPGWVDSLSTQSTT